MDELEILRQTLDEELGEFPTRSALSMQVVEKRKMLEYEEWRIVYTVETEETMPQEAGRTVPAYLLIPKSKNFAPPYPAMVACHQCNIDCVIGKEAVAGKVLDREDQAYGLELVRQGFVVIAPDSLHCGQRNLPAIRNQGENRRCHGLIFDQIGRKHGSKRIYDYTRAIDLLESLDIVDDQRIGTIGHSMGAGDAYRLMAKDERIKAGIFSGDGMGKYLPLHAPRLHISLCGQLDREPDRAQKTQEQFEKVNKHYKSMGAPDNLILRTPLCGHYFIDAFKWESYFRLKQYFGISSVRKAVSLEQILQKARTYILNEARTIRFEWQIDTKPEFPPLNIPSQYVIQANEQQLVDAFVVLFVSIFTRTSNATLNIEVIDLEENYKIICSSPHADPSKINEIRAPFDNLRLMQQIYYEYDATLLEEHTADQIRYTISLPKS